MIELITWVLAIVAVEAVTEILVAGAIFDVPRAHLLAKQNFFSELIACGHCTSVWVAASMAWALPGTFTSFIVIDILIKTFALHRLSNYLHEIRVNWISGIQIALVVHKTEEDND